MQCIAAFDTCEHTYINIYIMSMSDGFVHVGVSLDERLRGLCRKGQECRRFLGKQEEAL